MRINETKEKKLHIAKSSFRAAKGAASFSKGYLTALSMGNDPEDTPDDNRASMSADPASYLTGKEAALWKRLPETVKMEFVEEGIREAEKVSSAVNSGFRKEQGNRTGARAEAKNDVRYAMREPWSQEVGSGQWHPESTKYTAEDNRVTGYASAVKREEIVKTVKEPKAPERSFSNRHAEPEMPLNGPEHMRHRTLSDKKSFHLPERYEEAGAILENTFREETLGYRMSEDIFAPTQAEPWKPEKVSCQENMSRYGRISPKQSASVSEISPRPSRNSSVSDVRNVSVNAASKTRAIAAENTLAVSRSLNAAAVQTVTKSVTGTATTAASVAGKKTAEKFKAYLQEQAMATGQAMQDVEKRLSAGREMNHAMDTLPAVIRYDAATVGAAVISAVSVVIQAAMSLVTMLLSSTLAFFLPFIILIATVAALIGLLSVTTSDDPAGYGLPSFVTEEMMETFFLTQTEKGIPVSTGIAQLIAESGFGVYGPGGENGEGLSKLAYNYKNLFGIKYSSGDEFASGSVNMTTGEQTPSGGDYEIIAGFSVYPDYASCIRQRAIMLERNRYAVHVDLYRNQNDGAYTQEAARQFMAGIREGGWATSIAYVENCVSIMERYNLYRFDNMTWESYQEGMAGDGSYDGTVTPEMERIVSVAQNNQGRYPCTPDYCARWVTGVYMAAGAKNIPRGNAIDMWNNYKQNGSTSMENIPPGAVVCGSGSGYMGSIYGHVGIYLGNGMVANNVGHFSIQSLSDWCAWQRATCQGHTGWIGWVYPGGVPK